MTTAPLSARELILTLIDSASSSTLSARYFVAAGQLLQIDAGSIRVALGRLVRDGSLRQAGRGEYSLASRSGALHRLVRNWMNVDSQMRPWDGSWLAVFVAHLPRRDKTLLRRRERALRLYGLAEALPGLWLRPDNLKDSPAAIRRALVELGLDDAAPVATLHHLDPEQTVQPEALWDRSVLESTYRAHLTTLNDSLSRLPQLDDAAAAVETLVLGRSVTRDILLDPLLPDALIDSQLRTQMIRLMVRYNEQGKAFWRALYARHH